MTDDVEGGGVSFEDGPSALTCRRLGNMTDLHGWHV